jgi:hypothetical protein
MVIDNAAGITQNLGSPKGGELLGGLFAPCTSFGPVLKTYECGGLRVCHCTAMAVSNGVPLVGAERRLAEQKCLL